MTPSLIFFLLWAGHALCDFPLQGQFLSDCKNRRQHSDNLADWCMFSHCMIHGGAVALITGVWWLGFCEVLAHWLIDEAKIYDRISFHRDQALHLACKCVWFVAWLVWRYLFHA